MLYKKIHFVGLAIYATLSRTTFGAEYVAYANKKPDACSSAGSSDKCTFHCDDKSFQSDFDCGNAGICEITCDAKLCFDGATITATNSGELNVFAGSGQLCYNSATFHLPQSGSASFDADSDSDDAYQGISIIAGSNTQDIYLNCAGGDAKSQCDLIQIEAQNAQSLHLNIEGAKLIGPVSISCPQTISIIGGSNGAPCYINAMSKATLSDVTIHTLQGFPYDLWIDVDDTKNWDNVVLTCTDIDSNAAVVDLDIFKTDQKKNDCYNTRAPTTAAPTPPTPKPTRKPTNKPTLNPTSAPTFNPTPQPTSIPSIAPSKNPTITSLTPSKDPTVAPSISPTIAPTSAPTIDPTRSPSVAPSVSPTNSPTFAPSKAPSSAPTENSKVPTDSPTDIVTTDSSQKVSELISEKDGELISAQQKALTELLIAVSGGLFLVIILIILCICFLMRLSQKEKKAKHDVIRIASEAPISAITATETETKEMDTDDVVHIKHNSAIQSIKHRNQFALPAVNFVQRNSDMYGTAVHEVALAESKEAEHVVEGDDSNDDDDDIILDEMQTIGANEVDLAESKEAEHVVEGDDSNDDDDDIILDEIQQTIGALPEDYNN